MKWLYFKMFVFIMNWQVHECFLCCHGSCFSVLFLQKCDRSKHEIKWSQIENNSNSSSSHLQTLFWLNQGVVCCCWFCEFCKGEIFVKSPQIWNWWPFLLKLQNPKLLPVASLFFLLCGTGWSIETFLLDHSLECSPFLFWASAWPSNCSWR